MCSATICWDEIYSAEQFRALHAHSTTQRAMVLISYSDGNSPPQYIYYIDGKIIWYFKECQLMLMHMLVNPGTSRLVG